MSNEQSIDYADSGSARPTVNKIEMSDLKDVLIKGYQDFDAKPTHFVLLFIIYPIVGIILINLTAGYQVLPLIFPIIAGFALIGPFAAVGLYEISRRREQGLDFSIKYAFEVHKNPSFGAILTLSIIMMVIYFAWLGAALLIFELTFGETPACVVNTSRAKVKNEVGVSPMVTSSGASRARTSSGTGKSDRIGCWAWSGAAATRARQNGASRVRPAARTC